MKIQRGYWKTEGCLKGLLFEGCCFLHIISKKSINYISKWNGKKFKKTCVCKNYFYFILFGISGHSWNFIAVTLKNSRKFVQEIGDQCWLFTKLNEINSSTMCNVQITLIVTDMTKRICPWSHEKIHISSFPTKSDETIRHGGEKEIPMTEISVSSCNRRNRRWKLRWERWDSLNDES